MSKLLSAEEFEYQTMLGSTNDSVVFGIGHIQWQPCFTLSPGINISDNPFNCIPNYNSLYPLPNMELTINDDYSEYNKALEYEIKQTITDGKSFWNVISGKVDRLPSNSKVEVKINDEKVHITIKTPNSSNELISNLNDFLNCASNPPSFHDQTLTTNINSEVVIPINNNIDFDYYSREARKLAAKVNTVQKPFQLAEKRMMLYTKTPSPGGTTRLFPFERRFPKWAGKYGDKLISPRLGTLGIDMSNSTIMKASKYLKWGGRGIAGVGIIAGAFDMHFNGINFSNGLHTAMSVVALIPGGQSIAGVYFLVDLAVTFTTGKDIGAHIDDCIKEDEPLSVFKNNTLIFIDSPIKLPNLPPNKNRVLKNIKENYV
jgi:hypothetical protein